MKIYYFLTFFPFFTLLWSMNKLPCNEDSTTGEMKREAVKELYKRDALSQFHLCAKRGDSGGLKYWLDRHNILVDVTDSSGKTALYFAILNGKYQTILSLVKAGARVELISQYPEIAQKIQEDEYIRNIFSPRFGVPALNTKSEEIALMHKELAQLQKTHERFSHQYKKISSDSQSILSSSSVNTRSKSLEHLNRSRKYKPVSSSHHLENSQDKFSLISYFALGFTVVGIVGAVLYILHKVQENKMQQGKQTAALKA